MSFWKWLRWLHRCPCREELLEYALVGLPEGERVKAEEHLQRCPRCRDQVREYALLSEGLALSTIQIAPRAGLAQSIFKSCLQAHSKGLKLALARSVLQDILEHARSSHPEECCGVLLGVSGGDGPGSRVEWVRAAANLNKERAKDRYLLDPSEQLKAEKEARSKGRDVVGYYHSHPGHPAEPSQTDLELSWQGYHYLIVSVVPGQEPTCRCWFRRQGEGGQAGFEEVEIVVL